MVEKRNLLPSRRAVHMLTTATYNAMMLSVVGRKERKLHTSSRPAPPPTCLRLNQKSSSHASGSSSPRPLLFPPSILMMSCVEG
jgi:hypothetical protein